MQPEKDIYSVSELTHFIKFLLEDNSALQHTWVSGEISNFTKHTSGHVYFTLKDREAALACVMFRSVASRYKVLPKVGDEIQIKGSVTVYPPRGNYQMIVESMKRSGQGDLHQKFLELKEKLEKEGLFDQSYKKELPRFPEHIGVVTSATGAVIRDIVNTVRRRFPHVKLTLSPATVQGEAAAPTIVHAIDLLEERGDVDVIIVGRGGGSMEDLWCFNEEEVARRIFECQVPIVSAVGHETDFTIADFVADVRAATPTAAAEICVPDSDDIWEGLNRSAVSIERSLQNFIDYRRQMFDDYQYRLEQAVINPLEYARGELEILATKLDSFNVVKTLERGYSITLKDGKSVKSVNNVKEGDNLEVMVADGRIETETKKTISNG